MKVDHKPKIVVIGLKGLPAYGGAAAVGENIIDQLKNDYDFTVLSIASHTSLKSGHQNGFEQIVFKNHGKSALNTFYYYWKCLFHCLIHKYDLVHLHHASSGFITPILRLKNKVVVTFHGVQTGNSDPKFSIIHNRFFGLAQWLNILCANVVISVSRPDKEVIFNKYKRQIEYIPNGINNVNLPINTSRGVDSEPYVSFCAGRIYQIKGLHLLLKALKDIAPSTKLVVIGDLKQVKLYEDMIMKLSEGLNVEYLGLIKNKQKLYEILKASILFVFPSLSEAMSMILLEVASLEVPILASDIDSNKAIFSENEMLFFKSDDVKDLISKLQFAINNNEKMKQKASAALVKLKNDFTWQSSAQQYSEIYRRVLSNTD